MRPQAGRRPSRRPRRGLLRVTEIGRYVSMSCSSAIPRKLFHNATLCGRGLSSGTVAERIAPESVTPMLSRYVHRNISREIALQSTRSSLAARDKPGFGGGFLKFRGRVESNQKRGRVNRDSALLARHCEEPL